MLYPPASLTTAATLIGPSAVADCGAILVSSYVSASRTPMTALRSVSVGMKVTSLALFKHHIMKTYDVVEV